MVSKSERAYFRYICISVWNGHLIFRYINGNLIDNLGVSQAFLYWGIIVLLLVLIGSFFLREAIVSNAVTETLHNDYTPREMMRTKQVYLLFLCYSPRVWVVCI